MKISEIYSSMVPVQSTGGKSTPGPRVSEGVGEFEKLLRGEVHLSQHAEARIRSRLIPWDSDLQRRIGEGLDVASSKGSREALILADNVAVIANVESRTVITAMEKSKMQGHVFTNIDSAVLV